MSDENINTTPVALADPANDTDAEEAKGYKTLWESAEKQGIADQIRAYLKANPDEDIWWFASRSNKLCIFRAIYADEYETLYEKFGDQIPHKNLVDLAVVVGKDNVLGKRPKAGIFAAIADSILVQSEFRPVVPPGYEAPVKAE